MKTVRDRVKPALSHPPCERAAAGDVEMSYKTFEGLSPLRPSTLEDEPAEKKVRLPLK